MRFQGDAGKVLHAQFKLQNEKQNFNLCQSKGSYYDTWHIHKMIKLYFRRIYIFGKFEEMPSGVDEGVWYDADEASDNLFTSYV